MAEGPAEDGRMAEAEAEAVAVDDGHEKDRSTLVDALEGVQLDRQRPDIAERDGYTVRRHGGFDAEGGDLMQPPPPKPPRTPEQQARRERAWERAEAATADANAVGLDGEPVGELGEACADVHPSNGGGAPERPGNGGVEGVGPVGPSGSPLTPSITQKAGSLGPEQTPSTTHLVLETVLVEALGSVRDSLLGLLDHAEQGRKRGRVSAAATWTIVLSEIAVIKGNFNAVPPFEALSERHLQALQVTERLRERLDRYDPGRIRRRERVAMAMVRDVMGWVQAVHTILHAETPDDVRNAAFADFSGGSA